MALQIRGRGSAANPANRFDRYSTEPDVEVLAGDPDPSTVLLEDHSRTIIATNTSPDVGFDASVNPYRGCEHGCAYCYARPTHEYLGFSSGVDFESRILVKADAASLLRDALMNPRWAPKPLAFSGVTDAWQPAERRRRITRACLEVLAEFRNPVVAVTKSHLVTRDADLLGDLATIGAARVMISITTLDPELARRLEPRASTPARRLEAVHRLHEAGIPVGVSVAPVIPGLTDHEIPAILKASAEAGADTAMYVALKLPYGVKDLFSDWLQAHVPDRKDRVLGLVRSMRGGKLNDPRFATRGRGQGPYARHIRSMFTVASRRYGLDAKPEPLVTAAFRRPAPGGQGDLFG